jgi:TatD DNase family protein
MMELHQSMELIDTHAHLEDLERLDEALSRAEEAGVVAVVTMGSDLKSNMWVLNEGIRHQREGLKVYPAVGLHPWGLDASKIDDNLRLIRKNIDGAVAVGEIGLDYWYKEVRKDEEKKALQRDLFRKLLDIAEGHGKPVSIHSRGAWADSVDITIQSGIRKAVFHWFTGSVDDLGRLLDHGYYVSATPAVAYSKEHQAIIEKAPLEHMLLETDSPVSYRGETSEPSHILKALSAVSELKNIRAEKVAEQTTENARRVFGI